MKGERHQNRSFGNNMGELKALSRCRQHAEQRLWLCQRIRDGVQGNQHWLLKLLLVGSHIDWHCSNHKMAASIPVYSAFQIMHTRHATDIKLYQHDLKSIAETSLCNTPSKTSFICVPQCVALMCTNNMGYNQPPKNAAGLAISL